LNSNTHANFDTMFIVPPPSPHHMR